jgi:hypothetical protein
MKRWLLTLGLIAASFVGMWVLANVMLVVIDLVLFRRVLGGSD